MENCYHAGAMENTKGCPREYRKKQHVCTYTCTCTLIEEEINFLKSKLAVGGCVNKKWEQKNRNFKTLQIMNGPLMGDAWSLTYLSM